MKNKIFRILGIILILGSLLYLNLFMIMYNIKVTSATDTGVMLSVFGQDFYYEYNVED